MREECATLAVKGAGVGGCGAVGGGGGRGGCERRSTAIDFQSMDSLSLYLW